MWTTASCAALRPTLYHGLCLIQHIAINLYPWILFCRRPNAVNPLHAELSYLNYHTLDVVSRYRDPQLQVGNNCSYLFNLRPNICKYFKHRHVLNWKNKYIIVKCKGIHRSNIILFSSYSVETSRLHNGYYLVATVLTHRSHIIVLFSTYSVNTS